MGEQIAVSGLIATDPKYQTIKDGVGFLSFRLAANSRRYVAAENRWVTGETNWFSVLAFRGLAVNASQSLSKGDRIVVTGRLKIRDWDNGERSGTNVEIDAESIGLDLMFGVGTLTRVAVQRDADNEPVEESEHELQPA
jgi:single-strand DNA-binding protein